MINYEINQKNHRVAPSTRASELGEYLDILVPRLIINPTQQSLLNPFVLF